MSPYGAPQKGQKPRDLELHKFDKIYFTRRKAEELGELGIPYSNEYFLVMSGNVEGIQVMGSCGGRTTIGWDEEVIASHTPEGSEPIRAYEEVEGIKTFGLVESGARLGVGEDLTTTNGILKQEGLDKLSPELQHTILKIVGGNPGATHAACAFIKEEGLDKVETPADIERILEISADAPFDDLLKHRGELWDRFQARH